MNIDNIFVSYSKSPGHHPVINKKLSDIINAIKSDSFIKQAVDTIRGTADPKERADKKWKTLPFFTFTQFKENYSNDKNFINAEYIILDDDHDENLEQNKALLSNDPSMFMVFKSPSGDGLKIVIKLSTPVSDKDQFIKIYKNRMAWLEQNYGIKADPSTASPSDLCFMSHDPDLYINPDAVSHDVNSVDVTPSTYNLTEKNSIELILEGVKEPGRNAAANVLACFYKSKGMDEKLTLAQLRSWNHRNSPKLPDEKLVSITSYAFNNPEYGNEVQEKIVYSSKSALMADINKKYAFCVMGADSAIIDTSNPKDPQFLKTKTLREILSSHGAFVMKKDYNGKDKATWSNAYDIWMGHAQRRSYSRVVFKPGQHKTSDAFNLWFDARTITPVAGAFPNIDNHIKHIICGDDQPSYDYLMKWMAHLIQKPEEKPGVAVLLQSSGKGTGKGVFIDSILMPLVGKEFYSTIANSDRVIGRFNKTLERCLLCFLDESFFAGDIRSQKTLDTFITAKQMQIERKGIDTIQVDNYTRFVLATNDEHAIHASSDERRYLVLKVSEEHKQDPGYFLPLCKVHIPNELPAFFDHLLKMDISSFDMYNPPKTEALKAQSDYSLDSFNGWYEDFLESGELEIKDPSTGFMRKIIDLAEEKLSAEAGDVYQAYVAYCRMAGYNHMLKPIGLSRRLTGKGVSKTKIYSNSKEARVYIFKKEGTR